MLKTRRAFLLLSTAVGVAAWTGPAEALFLRSGYNPLPPGGTTSITLANKSASDSPTTTPLQVAKGFVRGAVPSGSIAVPTISGVALTYQADNRTYWDDGSLRFAVFRCLTGAITAGATTQVSFPISTGSYTNTSSNTTADITGNSDYKIALTNLHTAQIALTAQLPVSLTISGGAITGGTVWSNLGGTSGTINVQNGGGSGGQVSVSGTTLTVVNPGSGYANVGTGSFSSSFNSIVSAVGTNGNHNGASLVQYSKGPVCDAWRARAPISGAPHLHATFYVERWKDGSGSFLAFRAYCVYGIGLQDTSDTMYNYTFSLDWKNGATVIRGTTNGDLGFTNNTVYMGGSAATFGRGTSGVNYVDTARPDWDTNSAILNAIIPQLTPTECDQLKATGLCLPWLAITPTVPQPNTTASYTTDGTEDNYICVYQPNGSAGIRCPFGSGGSGHNEAPMPDVNTLHWMWLKAGNPSNANLWLGNSRAAAAHGLGATVTGSGLYDPTTLYVPNVIPTSAATFTGMTPTLQSHWAGDITQDGYLHAMLENGSSLISVSVYHQPFYAPYVYILEGEQWGADAMLNAGTVENYCFSQSYHRQCKLGSTIYYGVWGNQPTNERIAAWATMASSYAATLPTVWADGTTNIEQSYAAYLAGNTAAYLNALVSFSGSVTFGTSEGPYSKTVDFTGTGVYPEMFVGTNTECGVPFMTDYTMMCYSFSAFLLQGTTSGTALAAFRDYYKQQYVGLYAYSGSHYLNDTYRLNVLTNPAPNSAVSDSNWSSEGNAASPALAVYPHNSGGATGISMNFTSGSATIQLVKQATSTPDSMYLQGTNRIASGSRVKLTTTNLETTTPLSTTLPTGGFDGVTWYYWNELTATTGQLCTDAGLTSPVTPTSSPANVFFWVVPANTLPADNSGDGTYNQQGPASSGRYTVKLGTCRMMQRFGVSDTPVNLTNAITNLNTIVLAVYGSDAACYQGDPLYGLDSVA